MSETFRLDHKIGFQNTFYTRCINVIIDSIGPSIILRSIYQDRHYVCPDLDPNCLQKLLADDKGRHKKGKHLIPNLDAIVQYIDNLPYY